MMSEVNQYHEGMTLTLGYKTIFVPADKVSSLINTLNKCSELEKMWNDEGPDYYVSKGDVSYTLTKHEMKEFIVKEGEH
jgi:hypothetical protein